MAANRTIFSAQDTADLFNKVRGKSSLARLSGQKPLAFNGNNFFTFSFDHDASIVAENGAKVHGGVTAVAVKVVPIKFEYGARVSDEFLYGAEEVGLQILESFREGAARKFAKGFDIAAMHGYNPYSKTASDVVGNNHLDYGITETAVYDATKPDAALSTVITELITADKEVNGIALAPAYANALGAYVVNGVKQYPEFAFGAAPETFAGHNTDVNPSVSTIVAGGDPFYGYVGDFENAFRWGFGKEVSLEVIEYGDPDNTGYDLKGHNQVYLRCEAYIGWGILDFDSFGRVDSAESTL